MHCCKSQSHYTGDERWENMGSENPPYLSPGCFVLHGALCTLALEILSIHKNHRCSKIILKTVSYAVPIISPSLTSDEGVIAEDHHSETRRSRIQSFYEPNDPNSSWHKPHQRPKLIMRLAVRLSS